MFSKTSYINFNRAKFLGLALILIFQVWFCCFDIKNFREPLSDYWSTDTEQWENMSYYLAKHLSFPGYPKLELTNNDHFYPYGSNHAFQGWFLEGNYFYTLCYNWWGSGPWLNIYYALSVLINALGVFFLIGYFFNYQRAILVALLVSFLNFHALNRYPAHFAYSIIHWATISIFLDFIIVRKFVYKEFISLRLILFKIMIMSLALGLDLAYILGFALNSFFFSGLFLLLLCIKKQYRIYLQGIVRHWYHEVQPQKTLLVAMLLITGIAWWLYVPVIWQVFSAVRQFHFDFAAGFTWDMPLRLFLPYFKSFNAAYNPFKEIFHDRPEGLGSLSPGLFCMAIAIFGFIYTPRKARWVMIPFLIFFLLAIGSHPVRWPIIQALPWCKMYRVTSRITIIIPIFCSFLFLMADYSAIRVSRKAIIISLISVIGVAETYTVFGMRYNRPAYTFDASFKPYIEYVKKQKGEAVLDWPFCVAGGNGVGTLENLCPTYEKSSGVHTLKRFHDKKTIGHYYGRLHPSLIQPFLEKGWNKMFVGDSKEFGHSTRLINSFTPEQWTFFTEFFKKNDFAGINLYVDLLPANEIQEFYKRFGQPTKTAVVPIAGKVVFIPKPKEWFKEVNVAEGKKLSLSCNCKK
ncbi:hypothetical protein [Emticicia sp. 17c]|uniref:hypothetical protein n=1 Tax=Emticicia sp. 17c TaxID=3127704 RepID=UPI00301BCBA5